MSRTKKTAINSAVGIACMLISSLLSFGLQAVFIRLLGLEYSGINSLFGDILKILNLAELGMNNAILFRLYKHVVDGNQSEIEKLISFYRKVSYTIGFIILGAGLCLTPFLHFFVKETPAFPESLWSLYIIVLATSVFSQFFHYKSVLIIAKQDRYIQTIITYSTIFAKHALQILVLWLFKNIYLYLLIALVTTIISGVVTGTISKRKYKHKFISKQALSHHEKTEMVKDVGSLSVYKLCRTIDATIDTFLISKFISVAQTAIYGSTVMVLNTLTDLLGQFNDGMIASVGDLHASGEKKRVESVFYQTIHFSYLAFGFCCSILFAVLGDFVNLWIGHTLSTTAILFLLINFYLHGFAQNVSTFRNSMGLFRKGWKQPAVTVVLNIVFSWILIQKMGIVGTLLGTLIATLLTKSWYDPFIVCKYGFDRKPFKYFFRLIFYFISTVICTLINVILAKSLNNSDSVVGIFRTAVCCAIVSAVVLVVFGLLIPEQKLLFVKILGLVKRKIKK